MMMVDTHAHIFAEEFKNDLSEVVLRAMDAGVKKILLPNVDESSINDLKSTVELYPDFFIPMMGLHPTSVSTDWKQQLDIIYKELDSSDYIAVGEIGVDLYWDKSLQTEQINAFEEQLKWSAEKDLPVSIHFRNATKEVINSIKRVGEESLRGVFHSFGGSKDELDNILQLNNFMIGVNGVVTYKNSGMTETLIHCPKDRLVMETDSPYLTPVPYRGKRNESSYLCYIVNKISEIWGLEVIEVNRHINQNVNKMFGLNII